MFGIGLMLSALFTAGAVCYDGTGGEGAGARRLIVSASDAGVELHVFARTPRTVVLAPSGTEAGPRRYASSDGLSEVTLGDQEAQVLTPLAGAPTRAVLMRASAPGDLADVIGEWSTAVGPGGVLRLGARIEIGPCGLPVGVLDSPDQGQTDLPLTALGTRADSLVIEAAYIHLRIAFPLAGGHERQGVMVQNGVEQQILLRRSEGVTSQRRPQDPTRPYPYVEREVGFPGGSSDIVLGGTLTLPEGDGPFPAAVLITGSGAQDRDQTFAGHRTFLVLADHLTRLGYAVLRMDDRGVGASTGSVIEAGLDDIAADVHQAVGHLRTLAQIDGRRIGLIGHSEGGYVAPIVAARDGGIAFLGLFATPAVTGRDVFLSQRAALGRVAGEEEARVAVDSSMVAAILRAMESRPSDEALEAAVQAELEAWLDSLSAERRVIAEDMLAARSSARDSLSLVLWRSGWFKSLLHHDPRPLLQRLRVPVLAVIGDLDMQVPVEQNEAAYRALFDGPRADLLTFARIPGVNHMLQPARTGAMEEYVTIDVTIDPAVLLTLDHWLAEHVPVGVGGASPSPLRSSR